MRGRKYLQEKGSKKERGERHKQSNIWKHRVIQRDKNNKKLVLSYFLKYKKNTLNLRVGYMFKKKGCVWRGERERAEAGEGRIWRVGEGYRIRERERV